jgi:hypothetical protein
MDISKFDTNFLDASIFSQIIFHFYMFKVCLRFSINLLEVGKLFSLQGGYTRISSFCIL